MIDELIGRVRETIPPSNGDNLLGFRIDCVEFFGRATSTDEVTVTQTNDPSELLRIRVRIGPNVATLQDVSRALTTAWQALAYNNFQATSLEWFQEAMVLRFVTVISGAKFFVSGCVIATGSTYPSLASAYQQNFGAWRRPLEPLPGGIPTWAL